MASTSEDVKIPLRMLINKEKNKVFFAEVESDFVDILLSFLTLPMGTIVRLLSKNSVSQPAEAGSFNNLYKSISNLDIKHFGSVECKEMLLNPRNSSEDHCRKLKLNIDDTEPTRYFICEDWDCSLGRNVFLSTYKTTKCKCGKTMNREIKLKDSDVYLDHGNGGVFVTEYTSFLIGDNMLFSPISDLNTSWIDFLGEENNGILEEKTFNIGCNELLNLLKCLILSKPPLTDTFLGETEKTFVSDNVNSELGRSAIPKMDKETVAPEYVKMTVKILVQKSNNKVLFAEARDDFVDFLFSFLTIPLGTVMHLLSGNTSTCSMDNFYRSVTYLDIGSPLKSQELKDRLARPRLASHHLCSNHVFSLNEASEPQIYCCIRHKKRRYSGYLTMTEECSCSEIIIKDPKAKDGGFVRAPAMFMVADDLVVTPLSYISSICFLSKLQIRRSDIEEQMIEIGTDEALRILKASLSSPEALTNGLSHILKKPKQEESFLEVPKQEK